VFGVSQTATDGYIPFSMMVYGQDGTVALIELKSHLSNSINGSKANILHQLVERS
jgi:hypothetical protein